MKKLIAIVALAISTTVFADGRAIDTSKLSKAQIAELAAKAEEMGATSPANVSATVRKEAEAWGDMGANMGKAMVGAAKEVGVAANDFAVTPLGRVTVAIVAYKIIGRDVIKIVIGSVILFLGWTLGIWILLTKRWSNVKFEYEPVLWGMYKKARIVGMSTSEDVTIAKTWFGGLTILISTITALIVIF